MTTASAVPDVLLGAQKFKMGHVTPTMPPILGVIMGLKIAYLCSKFGHSSFSHSRDMVGAHQNLNGSCDLTAPLSGMVRHPQASTCYNQPIYQI